MISAEEAKKYDAEISQPKNVEPATKDRICPNCQMPLILLKDLELSKILQLDICPKCLGIWLDHGEFLRYKEFQKEKIEKARKEDAVKAAEALRKFGQHPQRETIWQVLGQNVGRPFDPPPDEISNSTSSLETAYQIRGLAVAIEHIIMWLFQTLLRMK